MVGFFAFSGVYQNHVKEPLNFPFNGYLRLPVHLQVRQGKMRNFQ